eukprot:6267253-Amphidinium_carterae.1
MKLVEYPMRWQVQGHEAAKGSVLGSIPTDSAPAKLASDGLVLGVVLDVLIDVDGEADMDVLEDRVLPLRSGVLDAAGDSCMQAGEGFLRRHPQRTLHL